MSRIQAQPARVRPLVVLDFICDHCGKKLDAVVVAAQNTDRRIVKSYHATCWEQYVMVHQKLAPVGAN